MPVRAAYLRGTQRLVAPEETLARLAPVLAACGITRCADVTRLDRLGIPVYCAIRPAAGLQQVSNGKGLDAASAKVSSLMEAIELFHAECPEPGRLRVASARELRAEGCQVLEPSELTDWERERYYSGDFRIEWVDATELASAEPVWVPASAVFFNRSPTLHFTSTNGLASGNHLVEATLHALYELIERDAAARLLGQAHVPIVERTRVVDPRTIGDVALRSVVDGIASAGSHLVLLRVQSAIPIHTFWAILLSEDSAISGSTFNTGWGTHLDLTVAAARAVTEAAQSRATLIHGSREDALAKPVFRDAAEVRGSKAFRYFSELRPNTTWQELEQDGSAATDDLARNLDFLVSELRNAGHRRLVRCDLTRPHLGVPVVKLLAPSLLFLYR